MLISIHLRIILGGMSTMTVRDKLAILTAAGFTTRRIAAETGISQPSISRILSGQEPRERNVRRLDAYFSAHDPRRADPPEQEAA